MIRNPCLKKIVKLLQLARIANEKSLSSKSLLEMKEELKWERELSRREMLKVTAQTAAILPFSGLIAKNALANTLLESTASSPVVIVGGGVAGLVAAYQLAKAGIHCALYEGSERLGGRMFTCKNFNQEGMFSELGGEFVDTNHEDLLRLCAELKVGIQELNEEDQGLEKDLFYIQGKVFKDEEMLDAFRPLAVHISQDLKEIFGKGEVRVPTYKDASNPTLVKFDRMTLSEYLYSKKDIEKWALDLIGILYICEFGLELFEQSALNFLTLISPDTNDGLKLLGESDESKRIIGGSSELPAALISAIEGRVPIFRGHSLVRMEDRGIRLRMTFMKGETPIEAWAQKVICALPFSVLKSVEGISTLGLNPATQNCIRNLGFGTNSKLQMGFKRRLWRDVDQRKSNGSVITLSHHQYWESSRMQSGKSGIITRFLGGNLGQKITEDLFETSLGLFDQIFPGAYRQFDGKKTLQYWPGNPWSLGSYTCPKPGQYTSMHGLAAEPELSGRLCFAGEHTSVDFSGYMNGAVESGNLAARQIVGETHSSFNSLPLRHEVV